MFNLDDRGKTHVALLGIRISLPAILVEPPAKHIGSLAGIATRCSGHNNQENLICVVRILQCILDDVGQCLLNF